MWKHNHCSSEKAALGFMLIVRAFALERLWSGTSSMCNERERERERESKIKDGNYSQEGRKRKRKDLMSKRPLPQKRRLTLASSKQASGPFLYLGCWTISQGLGPSSAPWLRNTTQHNLPLHLYNRTRWRGREELFAIWAKNKMAHPVPGSVSQPILELQLNVSVLMTTSFNLGDH